MSRKTLTYVEIDYDWCPLVYGVGACSAVLGKDSQAKCWNTRATCASPEDYQRTVKTLRFVMPTGYEPIDVDAIPAVVSYSPSPAVIRPGEDLGERASITVVFNDFPYHDRTVDKYWRERLTGAAQADGVGYDPATVGTFWGKFRARFPYYQTRALRVIQGTADQTLDEMETRHYVMDSISGPTADGTFQVTAKDVLKLADDDKAKAPVASRGTLAGDLTIDDTTARLSPTGIGAEYPPSGLVTISNEVCYFTRIDDTLTLQRGQRDTAPDTHSEGDTAQLALEYDAELASEIIRDLLVKYADVPSEFIDLDDWRYQDNEYITRVFGALLTQPTSVKDLIGQLCEQVGVIIWWDEIGQQIRYRAIRQPTDAPQVLNDDRDFEQGSIAVKEQPDLRVSQVWVYYGVIDPTQKKDEARNYRSVYKRVEADAESKDEYGKPQIRTVYAQWISRFNRPAAVQMAQRIASSNVIPPRAFTATMPWDKQGVALGMTYDLMTRVIQDAAGRAALTRVLVTSYQRSTERVQLEAQEFLYKDPPDVAVREVIVDADTLNLNLRDAHDNIYVFVHKGDDVVLRIAQGVILGSKTTDKPALDIGSWPSGVNISVIVEGRIQGAGGEGGVGYGTQSGAATNGETGGLAMYTRYPIRVESSGFVYGGAGGGGGGGYDDAGEAQAAGGGGGGGAGFLPGPRTSRSSDSQEGSHGDPGDAGTVDAGGHGGGGSQGGRDGGNGGDPGMPGKSGFGNGAADGGDPGNAVDGASYVTYSKRGTIIGAEVN